MNWQTAIVLAIVVAILVAIVISHIRQAKRGKTSCSCGGGCSGCPMSGKCHH
ncbi:MAG TPA: FeoB-associated Cys-rich membrane protein [Bacillota bacterium]|nr:FeoB-associated Cys-rich membrane protein [Bacillota bacterium]